MSTISGHRLELAGAALAALALVLLGSGCSCAVERPNTQVIAIVDADPGVRAMSRTLHINVYGASEPGVPTDLVFERAFDLEEFDWPITVALAPQDRDPTRRYRVEAIAQTPAGAHVATVRAISGYVAEQTLTLRMRLIDACIGVECDEPGQTCFGPDDCRDATVDPRSLLDGGVPDDDAGMGTDAGPECTPGRCDDGHECTEDFCMPDGSCGHVAMDGMCDDGNPCTDDACTGDDADPLGLGCSHDPNEDACDDGMFCTGFDHCADGACVPDGDPCTGGLTCNESTDVCEGCPGIPCPGPVAGAWSACSYATTCATTGTRTRTVRTFTCGTGSCTPMDVTETDTTTCVRATEGVSCGTTSTSAWGMCTGFSDVCDTTGTQSRLRTTPVCMAGVCTPTSTPESQACTRTTNGASCSDGNGCTAPDTCMGGTCRGGPDVCSMDGGLCDAGMCDDGIACTIDTCAAGVCSNVPDSALCGGCGTCNPSFGCDYGGCDAGVDQCSFDWDCPMPSDPCRRARCNTLVIPHVCDDYFVGCDGGVTPDGGAARDGGGHVPPPPDGG